MESPYLCFHQNTNKNRRNQFPVWWNWSVLLLSHSPEALSHSCMQSALLLGGKVWSSAAGFGVTEENKAAYKTADQTSHPLLAADFLTDQLSLWSVCNLFALILLQVKWVFTPFYPGVFCSTLFLLPAAFVGVEPERGWKNRQCAQWEEGRSTAVEDIDKGFLPWKWLWNELRNLPDNFPQRHRAIEAGLNRRGNRKAIPSILSTNFLLLWWWYSDAEKTVGGTSLPLFG